MESDSTLATKRIEGKKKDKEKITLGLCNNSTGSDKLILLVIGKFASPRCLKGVNLQNAGKSYKNSKKSWMNTIIFQEWITPFDKRVRLENKDKKALLQQSHNLRFTVK